MYIFSYGLAFRCHSDCGTHFLASALIRDVVYALIRTPPYLQRLLLPFLYSPGILTVVSEDHPSVDLPDMQFVLSLSDLSEFLLFVVVFL